MPDSLNQFNYSDALDKALAGLGMVSQGIIEKSMNDRRRHEQQADYERNQAARATELKADQAFRAGESEKDRELRLQISKDTNDRYDRQIEAQNNRADSKADEIDKRQAEKDKKAEAMSKGIATQIKLGYESIAQISQEYENAINGIQTEREAHVAKATGDAFKAALTNDEQTILASKFKGDIQAFLSGIPEKRKAALQFTLEDAQSKAAESLKGFISPSQAKAQALKIELDTKNRALGGLVDRHPDWAQYLEDSPFKRSQQTPAAPAASAGGLGSRVESFAASLRQQAPTAQVPQAAAQQPAPIPAPPPARSVDEAGILGKMADLSGASAPQQAYQQQLRQSFADEINAAFAALPEEQKAVVLQRKREGWANPYGGTPLAAIYYKYNPSAKASEEMFASALSLPGRFADATIGTIGRGLRSVVNATGINGETPEFDAVATALFGSGVKVPQRQLPAAAPRANPVDLLRTQHGIDINFLQQPGTQEGMRQLALRDGLTDSDIQAVLERAKNGDPSAFQIVKQYQDRFNASRGAVQPAYSDPREQSYYQQ